MTKELNERTFDFVRRFVDRSAGKAFLALWAFAEASFWFIAPDFLLIIFGVARPEQTKQLVTWALVGSFFGGVFYYLLCVTLPDWSWSVLVATPFVTERMIDFISSTYSEYGQTGVLFQAFSFMSFKIWTALAAKFGFHPFLFFFYVMISRFIRLGFVTWLASAIGKRQGSRLRTYFIPLMVSYAVVFISLLIAVES